MANILVVEDDKDLNAAYKVILQSDKHRVKTAYNGQEALELLKGYTPDLILLDLLMPIMGGLELIEKYDLKSHPTVKVLIFTNMENSPEVTKAYNLGATRCIIKSWTAPQNLSKVVNDTLKAKDNSQLSLN
ncbi:response regulator [Patescibacteria group bacterium]|jgi:CheY-like chemotaxis protein|nr:response regulator [Patescibacteria group bacterium]